MAELHIYSDNSLTSPADDWLNFQPYVVALSDMIRALPSAGLPMTIGIYGEWGSGKTTLMSFLQANLDALSAEDEAKGPDYPKTRSIFFNPWKYDRKEALWYALIDHILQAMTAKPSTGTRFRKSKSQARRLLTAAGTGILVGLGSIIPGTKDGTQAAIKAYQDTDYSRKLRNFVNDFEKAFADTVQEYVGADGRLVVFIDDLDRCLPENAVTILESLKLFLDKAPCVFIIGADQSILQHGLAKTYGTPFATRDYLEKIVQVPIRLPRVDSKATDKLWDEVSKGIGFSPLIKELIKLALGENLRQWKRFLNAYGIASVIADSRGVEHDKPRVIARAFAVLLSIRYPDLYDQFNKHPDDGSKFLDMLADSGTEKVSLIDERLMQMELYQFMPFVDNRQLLEFCKVFAQKLVKDSRDKGYSVNATHLQEAFTCVGL